MSKTPPSRSSSDDAIHVLVMKDNLNSRALSVSSTWIARLGWTVGFLTFVTCAALLIALRSYKLTADLDPTHVRDLESQIVSLKATLEAERASRPAPSVSPLSSSSPSPDTEATESAAIDFSTVSVPDPSTLPFSLSSKSLRWRGNQLSLKFKLDYIREDGGSQQGRIVLVARGKEHIIGYPKGLFQTSRAIQIEPERGEYFSVSRVRFVNADFGPIASRSDIEHVDILIFNKENELIYFERLAPSAAAPPRTLPSPTPEPSPEEPTSALPPTGEPLENAP